MVWIERTKIAASGAVAGAAIRVQLIPVIGDNLDDVVGVVYLKDVARRTFEHRNSERNERVDTVMREAHFVPRQQACRRLTARHAGRHVHMSIVVDEYGGTPGW